MTLAGLPSTLLEIIWGIVLTFLRVWIIVVVSMAISMVIGTLAARVPSARAIIIPVVDVLESIPVVAFFPIVLVFFLEDVGGGLGLELSVDFLILTATLWNMILGAFEGVRTVPEECLNIQNAYRIGLLSRIRHIYFPSAYPKVVSNISPSFNSALFYITLSEVIQIGSKSYGVFGIGSLSVQYSSAGNIAGIELLIGILVLFIVANYYFIIDPWIRSSQSYTFDMEVKSTERQNARIINTFVSSIRYSTNQVVRTGGMVASALGRRKRTRAKPERQPRLTERQLNFIVGIILTAALLVAASAILEAGFYSAIFLYLVTPAFLAESAVALAYDMGRIAIVYVITLITMVPLAIVLGTRKRAGRVFASAIQTIYSIPAPIFLPILLITLLPFIAASIGEGFAMEIIVIIITFLSSASYIFFNVYGAVQTIPSELGMAAEAYSIRGWKRFTKITLPAVFPSLVTGSVASIGSYWGGLLVAEYVLFSGHEYSVSNGLMLNLDMALAKGGPYLLYADAIDMFLVVIIVIFSFLVTLRAYNIAQKRFSINV